MVRRQDFLASAPSRYRLEPLLHDRVHALPSSQVEPCDPGSLVVSRTVRLESIDAAGDSPWIFLQKLYQPIEPLAE